MFRILILGTDVDEIILEFFFRHAWDPFLTTQERERGGEV